MIINIKSFMATVMAAILVLAVVIPIAGSMIDLSAEKVYGDNVLAEGEYLMSETGKKNPRLAVLDTDDGVTLSVAGHHEDVSTRTVIFSDSMVVEFTPTYFKMYFIDSDGHTGYYTSDEGDYVAMQNGRWNLYKYTEPAPNPEPGTGGEGSKSFEEKQADLVRALEDPASRAALFERIPASNLAQFSESEIEDMVKEGVNVLRAVEQYKHGLYTWIVFPDSEGDLFNVKSERGTAYVDSDSNIYVAGATNDRDGRVVMKGTLSRMTVVHSFYDIDPSNIVCHYTPSGYSNILTDITYTDSTDTTREVTHFVIPVEYTVDKEIGLAGTLVGLVPVVLIVGLIVGLVSVHLIRRGEDF